MHEVFHKMHELKPSYNFRKMTKNFIKKFLTKIPTIFLNSETCFEIRKVSHNFYILMRFDSLDMSQKSDSTRVMLKTRVI